MSRRAPYLLAATLILAGLLGGHVVIETAFSDPGESGIVTLLTGRDWPVLSHLLVALPALVALMGLLLTRRTLAVPVPKIGVPLAILGALAWSSILVADNKASALLGAVEWSAYGLVFFAVVAGGGRSESRTLLGAIAIGGTAAAALAVRQYGEMKGFDPGFRAQGSWNNPNAIGAYLGVALVAALALVPISERTGKLLAGLGAVLITLGLALTQSRGAYLTTGIGVIVWIATLALTRSPNVLRAVGVAVVALALGGLLTVAATRRPTSSPEGSSPFGRVGNAQEASVQSVGFRRLMWRSAIALTRETPYGGGLNSFGPRSAQPGLATQTQLAHSTPLQLAAEISPVGALLFLGFFGIVLFTAARGARKLNESRKGVFAGAMGALVGLLLHNFGDSDGYYFGLGVTLFALAAIALLAASDTSAPELIPTNWRWAGTGGLLVVLGLWGILGQVDRVAAVARGEALTRQPEAARATLESLGALVQSDGRLLSRRALVAASPETRLADLRGAALLSPTTRNLRAWAAEREHQGDRAGAILIYRRALELDPNNFPSLTALRMLLEADRNPTEAERIAQRTVAIEGTSYYTVRSQPEVIPTATAEARQFLAGRTSSGSEKVALLLPALKIYQDYATTTVPGVVRFDDGSGAGGDFGGETRERAETALSNGRAVARALSDDGYRDAGRLAEATAAFDRAEALLRRASVNR